MSAQRVVTFHYTLTDSTGEILDSTKGEAPFGFLEGAGQIIPGLESQILNLEKGTKKKITVTSDNAYGPRDENLVKPVPREQFEQKEIKVGDQFQVGDEHGGGMPLIVVDVSATHVTLDANHPLAGVDLTFDVEIIDSRPATKEELSHGHAHGGDGHHH